MPLTLKAVIALVVLSTCVTAQRVFIIANHCNYTIWPALYTDLSVGSSVPNQYNGWKQDAGDTISFSMPSNWTAARVWGRTECNFNSTQGNGPWSCATGGCNGGLVCDLETGTGIPPATLAEWTLDGGGNIDYYSVSVVDGFNIPMSVTNNVGCGTASCPTDLNANCPSALQLKDQNGTTIGCKSACDANLDGNPDNSTNCCTGSYVDPTACPSSGVEYYPYFKGNCPNSSAYAYDESSNTAQWQCDSDLTANYTLTFCP